VKEDLQSAEKTSMPHNGNVAPDCVKQLNLEDTLDIPAAEAELESLLVEQALLEELLNQQLMEEELSRMEVQESFSSDPFEQQKSLLNRTIPSSSSVAPSA